MDLSSSIIPTLALEDIICRCRLLECLSLEGLQLSDTIIRWDLNHLLLIRAAGMSLIPRVFAAAFLLSKICLSFSWLQMSRETCLCLKSQWCNWQNTKFLSVNAFSECVWALNLYCVFGAHVWVYLLISFTQLSGKEHPPTGAQPQRLLCLLCSCAH